MVKMILRVILHRQERPGVVNVMNANQAQKLTFHAIAHAQIRPYGYATNV